MRFTILLLLFVFLAPILNAQVPVKKDIMPMIDKCPSPPTSVSDAYAKISKDNPSDATTIRAAKLFEPIDNEAKAVEAEYVSQQKSGMSAPGMAPEAMKKMSDPEMKKKMKGMSKEEKMKMAMEMMKSMPTPGQATEMDPPAVRAALDEWQKVYNTIPEEFQKSGTEQQKELKIEEEYQKSQNEIAKWESDEIKKLPRISSGEMDAPDPVKVKEVRLKAADKHIALANKHLETVSAEWKSTTEKFKTKYSPFYKKLVVANYAADTKNFSSKKILSDAQMTILKNIQSQIERSRKAWEESASWQARKMRIELEKVQ